MSKNILFFIVPIGLVMAVSFAQLMRPFGPMEIVTVLAGSIVTGGLIGVVLFLVNKHWFRKLDRFSK
ncbi:hypothetical protein GKZ89_15055 [Bacillus mangrovi]|uniref:Uncharacterized protein n=1 Tax=Metabacillus mangrovi TaxID=1491830 RepID=A0A7X2V5S0_9BACI|nr:hypothetical protein [Metabacillus mangrovi]MTH54720.1 hypothetical protein [Metabacillus mangrovi]